MKSKENGLILTLCFIVLSGVMNSILFNVALVDMKEELKVTASMISWVVIIYTMIIACGSITYSKLASYFQLKTLLVFGVCLFVCGSIIGSITNQYIFVIIARIIQSAGGSAFIALSMITANQYMIESKRNMALTLIGGCLSLGSGIGFLIGGTFTYAWGWHSLFLLMLLVVLTLIGLFTVMPSGYTNQQKEARPFDFIGLLFLLIFVVSFILGVKMNGYLLIITVMSVVGLMAHGKRKNLVLFVDLSIFRHFAFSRLIMISFVNNAAMVGMVFLFPLLSEQHFLLTAISTGLILGVISILAFLISFIAKKSLNVISSKQLIGYSTVIQLTGFLMLASVGVTQLVFAMLGVFAIYIGFTMMTVAINIEIPRTIVKDKNAMGLGIYNLINFLGMSFGPAISSRILNSFSHFSYAFIFFIVILILSIVLSLINVQKMSARKAEV
ncbi:DHA2 family metal-tetracycline-proton antiporter-like MFS transporter [Scopulibacillus darangshiensis]|uniref:DHA2 family metal-tetracycline-proton antiporter-like MFS transporter n=1 Tax=Scopulibacillus darangshiensis TaxID=442528 RepID=A0A4R2NYC4_9BACL|nr:MFS transporter [Scopulibacillus darangshiensis]TCP27092.1 DHA2 family metal-tetracycline-proton antiporter-like MFS transporter [Scopulibacillus darangshiensis]